MVDWKLICYGCLFYGPLTIILTYCNAFLYLALYTRLSIRNFLFDYQSQVNIPTQYVIQSLSFYTIVCIQSFSNIWAIRSRSVSFFKIPPFKGPRRNFPMLLSVIGVYLFVVLLINVPFINNVISTRQIPWPFYLFPFVYAFFIFSLNEIRLLLMSRFKRLNSLLAWWFIVILEKKTIYCILNEYFLYKLNVFYFNF